LKKLITAILVAAGPLAWGCAVQAPKIWHSTPPAQHLAKTAYEIELQPVKGGKHYYTAFRLTVKNKSGMPLTIDWQKTRYLLGGRVNGGFMFAGLDPKMLNAPPADTITPGGVLTKEIWPVKLIAYAPYREKSVPAGKSGFSLGVMPLGPNGIALVLRQGAKVRREALSVTISRQ